MSAIADFFARLSLRPDKASFDAGEKLLETVKTALVGLAAYKTVDFFAGMIEGVAGTAKHLEDLSKQTGINTDSLQELGYIANRSGIDLDTIAKASGKLGLGLDAAIRTGTGPAAEGLQSLGISLTSVRGKMVGPGGFDDVLNMVADSIQKMPDGFSKQNAMMKLFGRNGKELIPMMADGAAGLDAMRARAHDLGIVMDEDAVKGLAGLDDSLRDTGVMLAGLKQDIVVAFLPTVKELIADFTEWFRANRKIIGQKIAAVVRVIALVFQVLGKIVGYVVGAIQFFSDNLGILFAAVAGLTVAIVLFGNESIFAALKSAAAWVAAALPLILMAAIVAALILIVQDLWTWFDGGDSVFKRLYESAKNWIGEKMMQVINFLIRGLNKVIEAAEDVANAVKNAVETARAGMRGAMREMDPRYQRAKLEAVQEMNDSGLAKQMGASAAKRGLTADQAQKELQDVLRKNVNAKLDQAGILNDEEVAGKIDDVHFGRVKELSTSGASGIGADVTTDPEQYDTPAARAARAANMLARTTTASALVPSATTSNTNATVQINVNAGAGADGAGIATRIKGAIDDWFDDVKRQAKIGSKS